MAYVSSSISVRDSITIVINAMRDKELRALGATPTITMEGDEPHLIALYWGEQLPLYNLLPRTWGCELDRVRLSFTYTYDPKNGATRHTYTDVPLRKPLFCPPNTSAYHSKEVGLDFTPGLQTYVEFLVNRQAIQFRWDKTRADVQTYLLNCKSLNEALKLWPGLSHYVPADLLARVEQKVTRATPVKKESGAMAALAALDTDQLVANVVMARLAESKGTNNGD